MNENFIKKAIGGIKSGIKDVMPQPGEKLSSVVKGFNPIPPKSELKSGIKTALSGIKKVTNPILNPIKTANDIASKKAATPIPTSAKAPNDGPSMATTLLKREQEQPTKVTEHHFEVGQTVKKTMGVRISGLKVIPNFFDKATSHLNYQDEYVPVKHPDGTKEKFHQGHLALDEDIMTDETHQRIHDLMPQNATDVSIGKPSKHSVSNYDASAKGVTQKHHIVYPVTYKRAGEKGPGRQTYFYHKEGEHNTVHKGLPKRMGGDHARQVSDL